MTDNLKKKKITIIDSDTDSSLSKNGSNALGVNNSRSSNSISSISNDNSVVDVFNDISMRKPNNNNNNNNSNNSSSKLSSDSTSSSSNNSISSISNDNSVVDVFNDISMRKPNNNNNNSNNSSSKLSSDSTSSSSNNSISSISNDNSVVAAFNDISMRKPKNNNNNGSDNSSTDLSTETLETIFKKINCDDEHLYSNECNKFLLKKEIIENNYLAENTNEEPYLYPNLNDPNFNIKIANKKEFNDTKYDGTIYSNIKEQSDILANADYELQPHQAFVKNFMSFQTPYNSLLLYHGLGSGKTCSAIGVCEENRDYMKQMGINKRIIIVASENVQDNFKLQLFDERKLKIVDGIWNIKACTGNKLLKEINPMNMNIPKEKVISQIKNLINTYYIFLGYGQFANYIIKTMSYTEETKPSKKGERKVETLKDTKITLNTKIIKRLRNEFNNRLIVIDEVHNIRKTEDNENKKVAINLEILVKSVQNLRLLLLSATPMYNSYKEIVWLLNLMNINDRRSRVEVRDIFDKNGEFKSDGEDILIRKATGYVSFVRGENPYTFPYRVYPSEFAKDHTFPAISYPDYQMNLKKIPHESKKRILSLYLNKIGNCNNCGKCQYCVYKYIIYNLRNKEFTVTTKKGVVRDMPSFENMESFGYTLLQTPLESLIISYPIQGLKNVLDEIPNEKYSDKFSENFSESPPLEEPTIQDLNEDNKDNSEENDKSVSSSVSSLSAKGGSKNWIDSHELTGKKGLERVMNFVDEKTPPKKGDFEYKSATIHNYGKIFSQELIGNYSWKIKSILDNILNPTTQQVSEGIILIYSQYIDSGLIPVALALEEMGFTRYGDNIKPLFKNKPTNVVDVKTMKPPKNNKNFMPARYSMITGDPRLSPNNDFEVKGLTGDDNIHGNKIKVVLISKAGSEGIDLKYIRQVHILEPWYNMNRPEQIIGRAVRNFSHKDLPFENRNVEIFMYGTILEDNKEEAADLYVYRVAEYKAIQIGKVSRVLKESAVDCIINHDQTNFTQELMSASIKTPITQILSNGVTLHNFKIGDAPFSPSCDYMASCNYSCRPDKTIDENELNEDTYDEKFILINSEKIVQKIRMLMKESFFYDKNTLIQSIRTPKEYPYVQIYSALTQLIEDNNEFIVDKYGRNGRLINIGDYYLFQPIELREKNISIFERSVPIDYKHSMVNFEIKQDIARPVIDKRNINRVLIEEENEDISTAEGKKIIDEMIVNYNISKEFIKQSKVPRGDDNWYKHCGVVMKKITTDYPEIQKYLIEFLVSHLIELLLYQDKVEVLNYLYSLNHIEHNSFEWFAKNYFKKNVIVTANLQALLMYNLNKRIFLILNSNNKWIPAEPEDEREIAMSKEAKELFTFKIENYNKLVGFIGYEKKNRYLVFKTKDMLSKRDTGARCDEAGKNKTMQKINEIIGETKYTNETTKIQKDENGNVIQEMVGHVELCVIQELILRYFDAIKKEGKKWFLTPEMAIYFKLYSVIP